MLSEDFFGLITEESIPIPLLGVKIEGDIAGRGAKIRVIQSFRNEEKKPIEAVYKFPLPEGGAVCGFKAIIGDKIIEGDVEERNKAFELYDKALSDGHGAYLLDEERPNIFTLSAGNLNPGSIAVIEIEYITLLEARGSEVRFFLPTTISPRYIPDRTEDNNGIPVGELIHPSYSPDVPYGLSLLLNICGKEEVASIESPSHKIRTDFGSDLIKIEFSSETPRMDRDFVLNIKYKNEFINRGYIYKDDRGSFLQIDLCPEAKEIYATRDCPVPSIKKEVIFALDCSGSMEGNSIGEAKKALEIFLRGLEEGVRFNIYRFGSSFEKILEESIPYTADNLTNMLKKLKDIDADMGGTEVLCPLMEIYGKEVPSGYSREVILITDGQIGNEAEVTELVKRGSDRTRLFTVGIGSGPNEYFIRQMARTGKGTSILIAPGERIEPKIIGLFKNVVGGRIDGVTIDWGTEVIQAPFSPTVFPGEVVSILARIGKDRKIPEEVMISGKVDNAERKFTIKMKEVHGENIPIPVLWAREMIRDLEEGTAEIGERGSKQTHKKENIIKEKIIDISREFRLLSRETSFIAIEKREEKDKTSGEVVLRKVPVLLTRGWHGIGIDYSLDRPLAEGSFDMEPRAMWMPFEEEKSISPRKKLSPYTDQDIVLKILSLQRAEGGFSINSEVVNILGISFSDLKQNAKQIEVSEKIDRFLLLSTAIIVTLLRKKFINLENLWSAIVQKSEDWLKKGLERTKPHIKGVTLEKWAENFIENLKFNATGR